MKILIIRHGDPDYSIDSLTEKGWREAELLSQRIAPMDIDAYFCSPLGRARDTASLTLSKCGREAEICGWLREFSLPTYDEGTGVKRNVAWDAKPAYWTEKDGFFSNDEWYDTGYMASAPAAEYYREVTDGFDSILARYGYFRDGRMYRTDCGNRKTIALFCHFGVESVILSHLWNVSPMIPWHSLIALPTSVTTVISEEREEGAVYFRCCGFGDVSHLYAAGEEPSFSGRFCENFAQTDERH